MKPTLKINFCDFWANLDKQKNLFTELLSPYYEIELSDNPDVLFYSCYSFDHLKYNCHKIFYTGENVRPDFNECDYSLTFDFDDYNNRNFRLPLFRWSPSLEKMYKRPPAQEIMDSKSKFCCMVVSNGNGKERNDFFEKLNAYKKIDSGGKFLNNIGYPVEDKVVFIKDYKFVLSFENSSFPGYTTEKIFQPMLVDSLAVYWGNPEIYKDFNTKSFINVHDYSSFDEAIEEIIRIDTDDELYRQYIDQPSFSGNKIPETLELDFISNKLMEVIESFKGIKPVCAKFTQRIYGQVNMYKKKFFSRLYKKEHWYC